MNGYFEIICRFSLIIEYYFMIIHFLLLQRLKLQKPADWLRLCELKQAILLVYLY